MSPRCPHMEDNMANKTGRRIQSKNGNNAFIATLSIVLAIVILGVGAFLLWVYRDKISGKESSSEAIFLVHNDAIYAQSANGLVFYSGDELELRVTEGLKGEDVKIAIYAADGGDFAYRVGEEPYYWSDVTGEDFTSAFTIAYQNQRKTQVKLTYGSLEEMLSSFYHTDVTVADGQDLTGDLFELVITVGAERLCIGFGIGLPATGVEINPDSIIF